MQNRIEEQKVTATVVGISWERVTVHIQVKVEDHRESRSEVPLAFYAVDGDCRAKAVFQQKETEPGDFCLSLNVTNPGDCKCLAAGSFFIYVCQEQDIWAKCVIDPAIVPQIESFSRSFLHHNRGRAYVVNFYVTEGENDLPLMMHVMDTMKVPMEQETNKEILKSLVRDPLVKLRKNAGRMRWKMVYRHYVKRYKNKKNTILFMSEQSDKLGTNLTSVYERMKERGMDQEYQMLTSARPASYIRQPKKSTRALLKKLAMCDLVFLDDHAPILDWLTLDKRTRVIQLWHAGAGFKSSGYSRWGHLGCPAPVSCHRQYQYGIAGSKHIGKFFSEVFGITDEQILPTGMPRMDEYLDASFREKKTEQLYQTYPLCKGKKVILFAPTYRGKGRKDAHYPYDMIDFDRLYRFCGEEYVVLFKMHPWVLQPVPIKEEHKDRFVDVNTYPNINDLFYITEILITDYSSNIFEYSLMKKPMLFFAFDKIQYSFSRGFHRDYEEAAPGKVCYTFEEIMEALEKKDYEYEKVERYVQLHFDYIDSHASDRVIDWILLGNIPEEIQEELRQKKDTIHKMESLDFSALQEEE